MCFVSAIIPVYHQKKWQVDRLLENGSIGI